MGKWTEDYFKDRLKAERVKAEMTQEQLAKALCDKGVHVTLTTIARIEAGRRSVRIDEASAIADVLDCSVDSLLGRTAGGEEAEQAHAMTVLADEARKLASQMGDATDRLRLAYEHLSRQFNLDYIDASSASGDTLVIPQDAAMTVEQRRAYLMWVMYQSAAKFVTQSTGLLNAVASFRSMPSAEIPEAWAGLITLTEGLSDA